MDDYSLERHRLLAAAGYPSVDAVAQAAAVNAHAAQLRAAAAAVAAYPDLGRSSAGSASPAVSAASSGVSPSSSTGSTSTISVSAADVAAYHGRYMPGALSIGTGNSLGLPFLGGMFAAPPTSPYRNSPGGLVNMRPFWPPTPPPDAYSRCGLSNSFYPMFSSVPSTESSHFNNQVPRLTPTTPNPFTHLFDTHKDVPFLSPTMRLGNSLTHPMSHHPSAPPNSHYLQFPSLLDRHPLSYGHMKSYEPQMHTELESRPLSSPIDLQYPKRDSHNSLSRMNDKAPIGRSTPENHNSNIRKVSKQKDSPKVATIKVYKHKSEDAKSQARNDCEQFNDNKHAIMLSPVVPIPNLCPSKPASATVIPVTTVSAPAVSVSSQIHKNQQHSTKCCNCSGETEDKNFNAKIVPCSYNISEQPALNLSVGYEPPITTFQNCALLSPNVTTVMSSSTATTKTTSVTYCNNGSDSKSLVCPQISVPSTSPSLTTPTQKRPLSRQSTSPASRGQYSSFPSTSSTSSNSTASYSSPICTYKSWVHHEMSVTSVINSSGDMHLHNRETKMAEHRSTASLDGKVSTIEEHVTVETEAVNLSVDKKHKTEPIVTSMPLSHVPVWTAGVEKADRTVIPENLTPKCQELTKNVLHSRGTVWKQEEKNACHFTKDKNETKSKLSSVHEERTLCSPKTDHKTTKTHFEQHHAINLSVSAKKSIKNDTKESKVVQHIPVSSIVNTTKSTESVSINSLNALSRMATSGPTSNVENLTCSNSWGRKSHKVKPSSMVSSIQSEALKHMPVNSKQHGLTTKSTTNSATVKNVQNVVTTPVATTAPLIYQERPVTSSHTITKETDKDITQVSHSQCSKTVLSLQETVSSTMVSVTSSVLPNSVNSSIPVGIAVAQLRQDSSNITVKRSLPVSSSIESNVTTCPPIITNSMEKAMGHRKSATQPTETNILVSQVHCTNATMGSSAPVTHWESDTVVRTSLPNSWIAPAPVVTSGPVVTPTVWVGQSPFTTTSTPAATATISSIDTTHLPLPPVGYQLARDPISGQIFLIPPSNIEIVDRSNIWSTYTSAPVQQIVTQPTAFHQQIIQQVTNGTKTEIKPCIAQLAKKPFLHGNIQIPTNRIETAQETKELKVIGAGGLNTTVQSTVAGITVQSTQPFTFPGFTAATATASAPAISYYYEPPTILHLTQTQSSTALQPTSLQTAELHQTVLQSNGLQVSGVSSAGLQIGGLQTTNQIHTEIIKRSQGTSPLTQTTNIVSQQPVISHMSEEDEDDDDDEEDSDDGVEPETCKVPSIGVTMAIQVDMDASSDNHDLEERAAVECHDSANQTDGVFSDTPKEDTEDEGGGGNGDFGGNLVQIEHSEARVFESMPAASVQSKIIEIKQLAEVKPLIEVSQSKNLELSNRNLNSVTHMQTEGANLVCNKTDNKRETIVETVKRYETLRRIDDLKPASSEISELDSSFDDNSDLRDDAPLQIVTDSVSDSPPNDERSDDFLSTSSEAEHETKNAIKIVIEDPKLEDPKLTPLRVSVDSEEDCAPLLPTQSHLVMDFIDHHGLDLLVDSIEEFASREQDDIQTRKPAGKEQLNLKSTSCDDKWNEFVNGSNSKPSSIVINNSATKELTPKDQDLNSPTLKSANDYDIDPSCTDGLGILCALAEKRFFEETGKNTDRLPFQSNQNISPMPHQPPLVNKSVNHIQNDLDINMNYAKQPDIAVEFLRSPSVSLSSPPASSSFQKLMSEDSMDPSEVEMRCKLAELQRKYKQKQKELAKLKPKKDKEDSDSSVKKTSNKSKKRRFSIFSSKLGTEIPFLKIPNGCGNTSDSQSASDFSSPPVMMKPIKFENNKCKEKIEVSPTKVNLTPTVTLPTTSSNKTFSPINKKISSNHSKKSNTSNQKPKSDAKSSLCKPSSSTSSSFKSGSFTKSENSKSSKKEKSGRSSNNQQGKDDSSRLSKKSKHVDSQPTSKPQTILSPRTSSDSEGERLFVLFWRNQRAENAGNSSPETPEFDPSKVIKDYGRASKLQHTTINKSDCSSSQEPDFVSTVSDSNDHTDGALDMLAECASYFKDETLKRKTEFALIMNNDSSDSEVEPSLKKAKIKVDEKIEESSSNCSTKQKTQDESKSKKIKTESKMEEKTKPRKKLTNKRSITNNDDAWNRRRSERIFLHDAGVTLPSTFTLVDEQSNCSMNKDILIEPRVLLIKNEMDHSINNENRMKKMNVSKTDNSLKLKRKIKMKKDEISKKSKNKEVKKQDKTVPDELFTALRQCRLSESSAVAGMSPANPGDDGSSSEGDVPLSILIERSSVPVPDLPPCDLKSENLTDNHRVLAEDDGLFYAGYIKAIQPPDIYGIVLDGERGNRPHIFSREEILNSAIMEVKPTHASQIPEGSRVCAYWSQQYRCLYPGTVAKSTSPNPLPEKNLVFVEFDDGDSGRIPIEDVRYLPQDMLNTTAEPSITTDDGKSDPIGSKSDLSKLPTSTPSPPNPIPSAVVIEPKTVPILEISKPITELPAPVKVKSKKTKILSKSIPKKFLKTSSSSACPSPISNASDSSRHSSLSQIKSKNPLKKKSKKNKLLLKSNHEKSSSSSSKCSCRSNEENSCATATSSPADESSSSASLSSKIKKRKKHKTEHKHRHHHHKHHHHHYHHKKHKHEKRSSHSSSSAADSSQQDSNFASLPEVPKCSTIISMAPEKGFASETSSTSQLMEPPSSFEVNKPVARVIPSKKSTDKKSELTVKIKGTHLEISSPERSKETVESKVVNDTNELVSDSEGENVGKKAKASRKRKREKSGGVETSKIAAFLPAQQLWSWFGKSSKRKTKGKGKKEYYRAIMRGNEMIRVGDCAVFLSTGRPHLPYVGRIDTMWESWGGNMVVKVVWFYHPEETKGKKLNLPKGALYRSYHNDENDVQTISHKCEVLSLDDYKKWKEQSTNGGPKYDLPFDNEDVYYLAGTYDPMAQIVTLVPGVL